MNKTNDRVDSMESRQEIILQMKNYQSLSHKELVSIIENQKEKIKRLEESLKELETENRKMGEEKEQTKKNLE